MIQDAGGVPLGDGTRMRTGMAFRISGALAGPGELAEFDEAGLRAIVDLRSEQEDRSAVIAWSRTHGVAYWNFPIVVGGYDGTRRNAMVEAIEGGRHVEFMRQAYGTLATGFGPQMASALERLSEAFPSGFGCAAGKDRTGVLGAYLQVLLGADEETAVAAYVDKAPTPAQLRPAIARLFGLDDDAAEIPEALAYVMSVQPDNLRYAFERVDALGGVEAYLRSHGLTERALRRLRTELIDPAPSPA